MAGGRDRSPRASGFDAYAEGYEEAVRHSIAFAGREHAFFTRRKAEQLVDLARRRLGPLEKVRALDVGCGVGSTDAHLVGRLGVLEGVDTAAAAVERAAAANPGVRYRAYDGTRLPYDDGQFDLVFAICVVHHVAPAGRGAFAGELARVVRPGGIVAVFEHNPFNPLTRLAVARCAFDDDVVLLRPRRARRLLEDAGLRPVERRYIVLVPSDRRSARSVEHAFRNVPLGAQYYVAAQRP